MLEHHHGFPWSICTLKTEKTVSTICYKSKIWTCQSLLSSPATVFPQVTLLSSGPPTQSFCRFKFSVPEPFSLPRTLHSLTYLFMADCCSALRSQPKCYFLREEFSDHPFHRCPHPTPATLFLLSLFYLLHGPDHYLIRFYLFTLSLNRHEVGRLLGTMALVFSFHCCIFST